VDARGTAPAGRTVRLESFVASELSRQLTWSEQPADLSHYRYRDQSKYEVDAVLENRSGHVVGIEVNAASTVGPDDFHGLRRLADRLGDDFIAGVVLYTGTSTLPFGDKLRAMPVSALWQVPAPAADWPPSPGRSLGSREASRSPNYLEGISSTAG
jgi:predicted AAA+ superfamily ATPase